MDSEDKTEEDKTGSELFDYIRSVVSYNTPTLKDLLGKYDTPRIEIDKLMELIKRDKNILLIDARSEKEFEESALPGAIKFPVLNNFERHNVGLIYKKYSSSAAVWLALKYAEPKVESLKNFLNDSNATGKNVIVYCWRGGGRSGYLAKMITDLGLKPSALTGGHKNYRKLVVSFFSKEFPYPLTELAGLTGSGKTDLLRAVSSELPVIDLELSARHFSSLFGGIPYDILDYLPVKNQSAFENSLFGQIQLNHREGLPFIIESESRKVGNFQVPPMLYQKMLDSPSIEITCSMESRVTRIVKDYFHSDLRGIKPMLNILTSKEAFFKQQLSKAIYEKLIALLNNAEVREFSEIMMREYYDKRYKDKGKKPIAVINTDDIERAKKELMGFYNSLPPLSFLKERGRG